MTKQVFKLSKEEKEFLQKVSNISGIKKSSIQMVWLYTIYTMLLDVNENKNAKFTELIVPYFGKVLAKLTEDNYDLLMSLNQDFLDQIKNVKNDDCLDLINFFDENFVKQTINQVVING
ncbi:MAG: hypothetical protein HUJ68_10830 [Clostridia bacterium]|nr:hypothetical protein [Clostridia bacterium]